MALERASSATGVVVEARRRDGVAGITSGSRRAWPALRHGEWRVAPATRRDAPRCQADPTSSKKARECSP